jgi:hypothetical protein
MSGLAQSKYRGPGGWLHMVDEHVIRAVTSRLEALRGGEERGREHLANERKSGFALVGPFYEALLDYERSRSRYPTLRDFYPRFIEVLRRVHAGAVGRAAQGNAA